ncbi:hypothetical protein BOTBODRAFT_34416 [Botryobasidium botryosum FD-172 SS1]|uniref:nicotinamidase n=1 Tax=Botryobasidium botryosum (strain FD-172 SS1) TaxID=930990 RepID=A0A067M9K4_BOTB1|nr:hypothetical protein BOTBODRAFT_34416 [Botryobasidium botryosum FD-172 SS1]
MANSTALVVVDVQNDFLPGGSLAAPNGNDILPVIYDLLDHHSQFPLVVASVVSVHDHPQGHISFASTHNAEPFSTINVPIPLSDETYQQIMWPDHCIQGSEGCELESGLQRRLKELGGKVKYIHKGGDEKIDSYSAFADNRYTKFTPLAQHLHANHISDIVIVGVVTELCVRATAIDARKFGFGVKIVREGVAAAKPEASEGTFSELAQWGCQIVSADEVKLS